MFNEARKAVWAAIITGISAVYTVVQTVTADDEMSADEWGLIIGAVVTAIGTVVAVYRATNKPATP